MSVKGTVDSFLLAGLHQGRVMRVRESMKSSAYVIDIRVEVHVVPERPVHLGYSMLRLHIPFDDPKMIWEFGRACGLERPVTKNGGLKIMRLEGRRPLMLVRSEADVCGGDVEVVLFLACRELQFERWL